MNMCRRFSLVTAFVSAAVATADPTTTTPSPTKGLPPPRVVADTAKDKIPEPPDIAALVARPPSEARALARHYDADRGALRRKYPIPTAPSQYSRLQSFYQSWLISLNELKLNSLSETAAQDVRALHERITRDLRDLDDACRRHNEIAPLLPFASIFVELDESRCKLDPFDPEKLAARLADLGRQIDRIRQTVADDLGKGDSSHGVFLTKARAERASAAVGELKLVFRNWHGFYAGYDPMFTWWTTQPFKEADSALDRYAKLLKEKSASRPVDDKSADLPAPRVVSGTATATDLRPLLTPASELTGVIQRYQADFGGRGRGPGQPEAPTDRTARRKQYDDWQTALDKLDFDKLGPAARIDCILLRTLIRREQQRLDRPAATRPRRKDGDDIVGRPIGREALLESLAAEMIPYSPEQLVELANREYAWCEAEMKKAAREMGFGDDWKAAVEKVKTLHVPPGGQPKVIRDLALEAIDYLRKYNLVTLPPLAVETWRMDMMSPERQRFNPFFTGGEVISVSFPTDTMSHDAKLQSMRGNNIHFSRATVHHELIPGHHLQQFMVARYHPQRAIFSTPFWTEGWAVYWEMVLYEKGFPKSPEDRVGLMFWRMHRCARVTFSLAFHLGKMTPQECIDFLVDKVGHERENATAEVRRSFAGNYPPLYQAGYLIGAKQFWALRQELVASGKMTERDFHDAILKESHMPVEMVRVALTGASLSRDYTPGWKFAGELPAAEFPK